MYSTAAVIAYGNYYLTGYDGKVWAHDVETGDVVWDWGPIDAGLETPYGHQPFYSGMLVADNKVIISATEHSENSPLYRGHEMYVIDAEGGQTIWAISGENLQPIAANGYIVTPNGYDGKIHAYGKGPSATTVTAAPKIVPDGSSVMIEGMVTDVSPGTKQSEQAARFPNGVPAIADEDMSAWMEYVYMQQPIPADAKGVEVYLDTLDPNGNWIHIGEATSDISGTFSYMWEPEIEGKYTVIATFPGSESYWASYAETAIGVGPAAPEFPEYPETEEAPAYTAVDLAIIAAVVVAIVIGLVNLWALRKRA